MVCLTVGAIASVGCAGYIGSPLDAREAYVRCRWIVGPRIAGWLRLVLACRSFGVGVGRSIGLGLGWARAASYQAGAAGRFVFHS